MKFGLRPVAECAGAILAHTLRLASGRVLRKGHVLTAADVAAVLADGGIDEIAVARLEGDDLSEDEAAAALGEVLDGPGIRVGPARTGRCNLSALHRGVLCFDPAAIHAVNRIDEGLTVATLPPFRAVEKGEIVATVKVVPWGLSRDVVRAALGSARELAPVLRIAPYRVRRAGLVLSRLPGTPPNRIEEAASALGARLAAVDCDVVDEVRCAHEVAAVAESIATVRKKGAELVLLFGASATSDRHDVLPEGVRAAGGRVDRLGMPVDPGHLLLVARVDETPILGAPGCARSPRPTGFDAVLGRVCAGVPPSETELAEMGVGGLLRDVAQRPFGRSAHEASSPPSPRIAAVVLAAGASRRMKAANKLLVPIEGRPMVARAVDAAIGAGAAPVVVVTGHEAAEVENALEGRTVRFVHNCHAEAGMSTSLRTGIGALEPDDVDAAVVLLGDMPWVAPRHVEALIAAFDPDGGREICVPTHGGKRGNPILWASRFFGRMQALTGDVGARSLLAESADAVVEIPVEDAGVLVDVDTREAARELGIEDVPVDLPSRPDGRPGRRTT